MRRKLCRLHRPVPGYHRPQTRKTELIASREQLRQLAAHVESAREEERIRIAREIHDELGQVLTVLKMDLEAVQARYHGSVPEPLKEISQRFAAMVANLDLTMERCGGLRPSSVRACSITWGSPSHRVAGAEVRTAHGNPLRGSGASGRAGLNEHQSTAVFRIFQEILTNIVRHAAATAVNVEVEFYADGLLLRVSDNGRGFDKLHLSDPKALGLLGMRERALLLGGAIDIQSSTGAGTTVTLWIPLPGAAAA